jgi:hypothetical protein
MRLEDLDIFGSMSNSFKGKGGFSSLIHVALFWRTARSMLAFQPMGLGELFGFIPPPFLGPDQWCGDV